MNLNIGFYSRNEVYIREQFSDSFPETTENELLMFASFVLRQFRNMGNNLVSDTFAGILLNKYAIDEFLKIHPQTQWIASELLGTVHEYKQIAHGVDSQNAREAGFEVRLNYSNDHLAATLDRDYLNSWPKIVKYKGNSKWQFCATWNPFNFQTEGFNVLGMQINYFASHSIISLLRYFLLKNKESSDYQSRLGKVAFNCAFSHIAEEIPFDQVNFARAILKKVPKEKF